ncbi:MAG TPA: tetratricopeptide repeat protein [Pyrinomonadaceae bacterium]|jgi:tetratricopeptide (TPR) repeat protein
MSKELPPTEALELFYSYSHKDEDLRDELETHLSTLRRLNVIAVWHDRRIPPGGDWGGEIDEHLRTADIILLLVSSDFIASDYCYDIELKLAMERCEAGEARVIPVILRPCDWDGTRFGNLQALPKDAKAVTSWENRDEAFTDIAKGIRGAADRLLARRRTTGAAAAGARPRGPRPSVAAKPNAAKIPRPPAVGFVARRDAQGRDIVGRLAAELAPESNRLVALWGPGGAGKSTLAAEFARAAGGAFGGRVVWVGALGRPEFSLATLLDEIATQLGCEDLRKLAPDPKASQVAALVSDAAALLVLDNFETIADEEQGRCLDFLAQRAVCPVLITTRSRVNHDDAYNIPLDAMTAEEARDFLQRHVERTRRPANFARLDRDEFIARCEANPLILQWVVSQIDLAKRPQDVLDELAQGGVDAAEHVFARSFDLPQLGDDGRTVLLALSLFTPSASRGALAEISGFGGGDLRRLNNAVERLSSLWLLDATEGNERVFLRGLTRELSKSRLAKDGRADEFRRRFVAHFRDYVRAHSSRTPGDLDALEAEKENVLAALDVAYATGDWASVISIRKRLVYFFLVRGYWDEAVRTGGLAEAASRVTKQDWCVAYFTSDVANVLRERGEFAEAERVYREALAIFRKVGKERNVAITLHQLGWIKSGRGEFDEARRLYGESLKINRRIGNQAGIASNLNNMGEIAYERGETDEARRLFDESLEINRKIRNRRGIAYVKHQLGNVAQSLGELVTARRLYNESLEMKRRLGDKSGIAYTLRRLGRLEEREGNTGEAARLFRDSLAIFKGLGSSEAERVVGDLKRVERGPA